MSSKRDEIVAIIWDVTPGCVDPAAVADRIIACMAEPSEAMVEAALVAWRNAETVGTVLGWHRQRARLRAALVAAGKAMVQP